MKLPMHNRGEQGDGYPGNRDHERPWKDRKCYDPKRASKQEESKHDARYSYSVPSDGTADGTGPPREDSLSNNLVTHADETMSTAPDAAEDWNSDGCFDMRVSLRNILNLLGYATPAKKPTVL